MPKHFSKTKKLCFTLIAIGIVLLLLLVCAEVGLRYRFGRIEQITGVTSWQTHEWEGITYFWDQYHSRLGWTNLPGYRSDDRVPFRVSINAHSLRGQHDYTPQPADGTHRVLVFGDSFAFGEEVDDEQSVPAHLQNQLTGSEVLNFGVHGFGLGQAVLRIEDEAFAFQPSYIVVMYPVYNFWRDSLAEFCHAKPVFGARDGKLTIDNIPVPEESRQPWLQQHSFTAAWLWGRPQPRPLRADNDLAILTLLLDRLKQACSKKNVPLTIVAFAGAPTLDAIKTDRKTFEMVKDVRRIVSESGLDVLDLVQFLRERKNEHGAAIEAPLRHWSSLGNCLIAREIATHLSREYPHTFQLDKSDHCVPENTQPDSSH